MNLIAGRRQPGLLDIAAVGEFRVTCPSERLGASRRYVPYHPKRHFASRRPGAICP
jgi:hypothetical protein